MRLSSGKIFISSVTALILFFAAFQIYQVYQSTQTKLADERARLKIKNRVPFEKKHLIPHSSNNVEILQNTRETRDLVQFKDSYFAATSGGLVQLSADGNTIKHFSVLDGLPESDLTSLIVFQDKLFIGTRTKNLVVFDGKDFENYVWTARKATAINAFLEFNGKLLFGTSGGLIEFDGAEFNELKVDENSISSITCLFKSNSKLLVGTFDNGLWISENAIWTHFTTTENLPSNRVIGFGFKDNNLYAATDFGLATLEAGQFRVVKNIPMLSSLAASKNRFFLTKDNGKIFTYESNIKEFSVEKNLQNTRLISIDETLFLLSNQGIFKIEDAKIKPFSQPEDNSPTDNFVSALAFDKNQNLWFGTFRNGVDVYSPEGKKLKHLESEIVREINFLQTDNDAMIAATSSGLVKINQDFSIENLTKKDGLPSDSITHFTGDFMATAKGLAIREADKIRVLSTIQGMPNNSIYTTLTVGKTTYAGTLGGLAEIQNNRVVRTFKDSNSLLTTNWVTALTYIDERLFIGTYGGGIFELLPSGEIRSFEADAGKFVVNMNALFSDGKRLYAGTLSGVKVLHLTTQKWQTVKEILPAQTVMSVNGNDEFVYFGTTNGVAEIKKNYFDTGENQ